MNGDQLLREHFRQKIFQIVEVDFAVSTSLVCGFQRMVIHAAMFGDLVWNCSFPRK